MKKMSGKKFLVGILGLFLVFSMMLMSCDNPAGDKDDNNSSNNENNNNDDDQNNDDDVNLDGTWNKGSLSMTISGSSYSSTEDGDNMGKGTVSYTNSTFTINITQAWDFDTSSWVDYPGTITGSYTLNGTTITISGVSGNTSFYNGTWTK